MWFYTFLRSAFTIKFIERMDVSTFILDDYHFTHYDLRLQYLFTTFLSQEEFGNW